MYQRCVKDYRNWDAAVGNGTLIKDIILDFMQVTGLNFPLFFESNKNSTTKPSRSLMSTAIGYLKGQHGIDTFLSSGIGMNCGNPTGPLSYIFHFSLPSLSMEYERYNGKYWKKKLKKSIRKLFNGFAKITNILPNKSDIEKAVKEIAGYEGFIAKKLSSKDTSSDDPESENIDTEDSDTEDSDADDSDTDSLNLIRYDNLQRKYSGFDFKKYVTFATINADPKVFKKITQPFYQYSIISESAFEIMNNATLHKFNGSLSSNFFGNYIYFRLLQNYLEYFPSYLSISNDNKVSEKKKTSDSPKRQKYSKLEGFFKASKMEAKIIPESLKQHCYEKVSRVKYANLRIYVDKRLPKESDRARYFSSVKHITDNVLIGMQSMIDGLSWMSPASKEGAYAKLKNLIKNYVYPEWIMNDKSLTEYYSELKFTDSNYSKMEILLQRFLRGKQFDKLLLGNGTDRYDWTFESLTKLNAWYQSRFNSITIPLTILQPPYFNPGWPTSVNFGAIGFVIGHEIAHGFHTWAAGCNNF
uniref:Uncharacterized protein n=1 Tax=Panagrolaimus sp. ES5 TaxID=591445 RepID=A0AC34FB39_9BILA